MHFNLLKAKIVEEMKKSYPGINPSITEWKGQEITDFQEELRGKVNARISEKWFYTHMKADHRSLPRIDMLNLLSRYAGYANWDDFVFKNSGPAEEGVPAKALQKNANRFFILVPLLAVVIVFALYGLFRLFNTREYTFRFYDADTREPIADTRVEVTLLLEGETPVQYLSDSAGCFRLKTDKSLIRMVVKSPYYRFDTITRVVRKLDREETVMLRADEYAMMIHYFSTQKVDDWEKRRSRLEEMIDEGAMIGQVIGKGENGMIFYNKQEFIDRMTVPAGSLKNIEILSTHLQDGKIRVLKFRIREGKR
jgi:hypothetical protein